MRGLIPLLIPCWMQLRPILPSPGLLPTLNSHCQAGAPRTQGGSAEEGKKMGSSEAAPRRLSPASVLVCLLLPGSVLAPLVSGLLTDSCRLSCSANLGQPNWPGLAQSWAPFYGVGSLPWALYQHGSASCRWDTGRCPGSGSCGWVSAGAR